MPYVPGESTLPRSLDVQISLSRPQAESRTRLDVLAVVGSGLGFWPDAGRVRFYSTLAALENDFVDGSDVHNAASAFFAQSPRAATMAVGEVWDADQPAQLVAGALSVSDIAALELVTDGEMRVTLYSTGEAGDTNVDLTGLDFSDVTDLDGILAVLQGDVSWGMDLTGEVKTLPGGDEYLVLKSVATGDVATISGVSDYSGGGTYVGALLKLTAATATKNIDGYTYVSIGDELTSVANAAEAAGSNIYGWALTQPLRVTATQAEVAEWALGRTAIAVLVTNDAAALDPADDTDLGSVVFATGNRRAVCLYHDNAQRYPDVSILGYMLSVNYRLKDAAVTAKFKTLPGIETVAITETGWSTLQSKGYNTYTAVGNAARTYRDGITAESSWYMDTIINLDNFVEDLSVAVFNVFLRNGKIPYTRIGQMLLVDACRDVGSLYTYNGVFADREVADTTKKSGSSITPAVQVLPTPISNMTTADRASRIGPPIEMVVQEAGAIHSVAVAVEVVS